MKRADASDLTVYNVVILTMQFSEKTNMPEQQFKLGVWAEPERQTRAVKEYLAPRVRPVSARFQRVSCFCNTERERLSGGLRDSRACSLAEF
jgi:hypothetical protein